MDNTILDKVTIIIPTYNRYPYLLRILSYYKSYSFPIKILILDSSTDLLDQGKFQDLLSNKKVCYRKINCDVITKIVEGLNSVLTPFAVFCGDDDFIVPNGVYKSVDFLERHSDFTVAHGRYVSFYSQNNENNKQQFFWMPSYRFLSIAFPDPKSRLIYHLSHYHAPTFYAVHRTDFLRIIFEEAKNFTDTDGNRFGELLLSMLTLIHGKMKFLDVFYIARQNLPNSSGKTTKRLVDYIRDGTYADKYAKFRDCLGRHLSNKARLGIEEAGRLIDDAMSVYLSADLGNKKSIKNVLIRKIKDILESSRLTDWLYKGIRPLYRKLFVKKPIRMDDFRSFSHTPFSKYYDEISYIHKHLLSFQIDDRKN